MYSITTDAQPNYADFGVTQYGNNYTSVDDSGEPEENITIRDNGDGTWTIEGETGGGYGDAFTVNGRVLSADAPNATVKVNGSEPTSYPAPSPAEPTAAFSATGSGLQVTADASASEPGGSPIQSYNWQMGDGTQRGGKTVQHSYASGGTYSITLTVIAEDGGQSTAEQIVTVEQGQPADGGDTDDGDDSRGGFSRNQLILAALGAIAFGAAVGSD
jgi:PKD repeat protein